MSDSSSVLCGIRNQSQKHPFIRKIRHEIAEIKDDKTVELCWIPGHVGIRTRK
jgi:hypothetical protein